MNIDLDDFRRHFDLLSDEALLSTNRGDLVGPAQLCYDAEIERRGLNRKGSKSTSETEAGEETAPVLPPNPGETLVSLADAVPAGEIAMARGLLEAAGIPCLVSNEYAGLGGFEVDLKVPASMADHALEVLAGEISEDELAAQAEAAGYYDEDESEVEEDSEAE